MNYLELTGALFGVAGVYLTIKEKILCFTVGIVNVIITAYLVFEIHLYADFLQQVVYFLLLVFGWIKWTSKKASLNQPLPISNLTVNEWLIYFSLWIISSAMMYLLLSNYTDAQFPFWDSTGTSLCFIAQWFIAKKKIENWLLWIIANVLYIIIYWLKGLPYYSVLMAIYLMLAIKGWMDWQVQLNKSNHESISENKKDLPV